jgi:predicted RNase H-like HicB family nuclease
MMGNDTTRNRSVRQLRSSKMKTSDQFYKWVKWSEDDQTYIGKCPDLTGIHGSDPVELYAQLCEQVDEVIEHLEAEGRTLPPPRIRRMQEVA